MDGTRENSNCIVIEIQLPFVMSVDLLFTPSCAAVFIGDPVLAAGAAALWADNCFPRAPAARSNLVPTAVRFSAHQIPATLLWLPW